MGLCDFGLNWADKECRNFPHNNPENQNFEKMNKISGYVIILYTRTKNHEHMMYAFWDKGVTDIIFCHFGSFFSLLRYYLPYHNHDHIMYVSWDMKLTDIIFCHFGPFLALLPHYWLRKLKFGKKIKKNPGDITLFHMCTEISGAREVTCHFGLFFAFEIKIFKRWKKQKHLEILWFYTCLPQMAITWFLVSEIWRKTGKTFSHFIPPFPFKNMKNQNFDEMKKGKQK